MLVLLLSVVIVLTCSVIMCKVCIGCLFGCLFRMFIVIETYVVKGSPKFLCISQLVLEGVKRNEFTVIVLPYHSLGKFPRYKSFADVLHFRFIVFNRMKYPLHLAANCLRTAIFCPLAYKALA